MKYFKNLNTVEEVRKTYKELALKYHPDINKAADACRIMQEINAEYMQAVKYAQNHDSEHLNCYEGTDPTIYPEIISKIITFSNLNIEICGSWVWLTGSTWLYAAQLKEYGFKFSRSKKAWYWSDKLKSAKFRGMYSLKQIREKFGQAEVETQQLNLLFN